MAAYAWKFNQPVSAQVAGEFLEKLEHDNGQLTPELVLENSRDENAVLHPCFEWNDSAAAELFRLQQAANIIRNIVRVDFSTNTATEHKTAPVTVRAFLNVSEDRKGKFVAVDVAFNNPNYRQRILQNALTELRNFQNKYSQYQELADVINAIEHFAATYFKEEF